MIEKYAKEKIKKIATLHNVIKLTPVITDTLTGEGVILRVNNWG